MWAARVRCSGDLKILSPGSAGASAPWRSSWVLWKSIRSCGSVTVDRGGAELRETTLGCTKGSAMRPPEARALDRAQRSIQHTHNPAGEEHAMRTEPAEQVQLEWPDYMLNDRDHFSSWQFWCLQNIATRPWDHLHAWCSFLNLWSCIMVCKYASKLQAIIRL